MWGIIEGVKLATDLFRGTQDTKKKFGIIRHAIIAEAKINKELSTIIYRAGVKKTILGYPKIFLHFSTSTSGILLASGVSASDIFGDDNKPDEKHVELTKKEFPIWFAEKTCSDLYEFYIRKCSTIKMLAESDSLSIPRTDIAKRCSNIMKATSCLLYYTSKKF